MNKILILAIVSLAMIMSASTALAGCDTAYTDNAYISNSYRQCVGNNVYWYDSCGNRGSFIQYCPYGCSNGACLANPCTANVEQRCSGNNLYWYDSCGKRGNFIQYCPNGCSGSACIIPPPTPTPTCSYHSYESCLGNNLYWFDSCGNQQGISQYCPSGCSNNYCQNNIANLTVTKTVKNLTGYPPGLSGQAGFSSSVYANPSDVLMFMITLQATGNQSIQNITVRDIFPANLIYSNQLVVACTGSTNNYNNCNANYNYSGSITSGINLSTIYTGQTVTITYQAQVGPAANFTYGTTTLTNNVSATSSNAGYNPTSNASVVVTRGAVLGASTVSTGLTNNFLMDSFVLPLGITLILLWMWRAGMFYGIEKWLEGKKKIRRGFKAEKELMKRISAIQKPRHS